MKQPKHVKMKRWPAATKVMHMCPECGYVAFKAEPMEPGYCPRCDGTLLPEGHEFNVPERREAALDSVINLDSMTDKLEG